MNKTTCNIDGLISISFYLQTLFYLLSRIRDEKKLLQCRYMYRYIIDDSMPAICFARVRCDHTVQSRPIYNRLVLDQYNNSDTTLGRLKFLRDLPTKLNIIFLRKKRTRSSTLLKYKFSFRIQCIIWIKLIAIFPYRALF